MEQNPPATADPGLLGLGPDELSKFAHDAGIPRSVDQESLLNFALAIAECCAEIGDKYTADGHNCGDKIRAYFGLG